MPPNRNKKSSIRATTPARRAAILDAALQCFIGQGVEATTIDDIVRASSSSIGSVYHHFGNKEGVAAGLFIDGITRLNADLLKKLARCKTAEAGVRTVVTQYCEWGAEHRDIARYLLNSRDISFPPETKQRLREIHRAHIGEVFRWFGPHVRDGRMKALPIDAYVPIISGPIQDYTRAWLAGQVKESPAKVKTVFADAAWNAVRTWSPFARAGRRP
jgi:AcrR family transcriptional regulator